jgi:hypothetical protein
MVIPTGEAMKEACSDEVAARRAASLQSLLGANILKGRGASVACSGSSSRDRVGNTGEYHAVSAVLPCRGTPASARILAPPLLRRQGAEGLKPQASGAAAAGT